MSKQIAVIGRGFGGLNIALELVANGHTIVLFGSAEELCASKAAIGVCTVKGIFEANDELFRQKIIGHHELFKQLKWLSETAQKDVVQISRGVNEVFSTAELYRKQLGRVYKADFYGLKGAEPSSIVGNVVNAHLISYPHDYAVDVDVYKNTCESFLKSKGVLIRDEFVEEISEHNDGVSVRLSGDKSSERFDLVVCAAGVGAKKIRGVEQDRFCGASMVPGWTFRTTVHEKFINHKSLPLAFVCGASSMFVSTNKQASYGSVSETSVKWERVSAFDAIMGQPTTTSKTLVYQAHLEILFKDLYEFNKSQSNAVFGVRIKSKDRLPVWCWNTHKKRTLLVFGFYKNGLTLAPLMAKRVYPEILNALF